ncbi:MAG: methionine synthase [Acidobacteriota bacterium]|nr:methionine synthase [Acidobacteriota bacterium]
MNKIDIKQALAQRVLVLDGATGTRLGREDLGPADFGGEHLEGCYEALLLTRPELIETVHREYLEAGADIVETDTFGGTPLVLAEYDLADRAREINRLAAQIARRAADAVSTAQRPRFVAGSMGPTTRSLLLTGGTTFEALEDSFRVQALGLMEGGVDYLLVETASDPLNIKAAMSGIERAFEELGREVPIALSVTIEASGTTLCGQSIEAAYVSFEQRDLLYFGVNCATGPDLMADPLRSLAAIAEVPIACVPNAGLPDEDGNYGQSPEMMAATIGRYLEQGWLNLIGGCCGTTAEHVAAFARLAVDAIPRQPIRKRWARVAGIDYLSLEEDRRPLLIGERTNVIGSRRFRRLIHKEDFDAAADVGRNQVASGAHVLDVCLADPDRDEARDVQRLLASLVRRVRVPLMIDTTDPEVIELALRMIPGKAIINSVNLEDGEERFARVAPLVRRFGASLVVGCIDEDPDQGMALTAERKLAIARRSHELLTGKYGLAPTDLIFDPLVFPCASGDEAYRGSARETIEGLRAIKEAFPECPTLLGVSNVSFGLPPAGREVLNSVFLHECTEAGLDLAIVNSEKIVRYATIPDDEKALALDLLYDRTEDPITPFAALYRDRKPGAGSDRELDSEALERRLIRRIVEARREGLISDLEAALSRYTPLEIINGPLLDGMGEVGRLFGRNELIVAEVLQSAEVMKAAVAHLEDSMEKGDHAVKGKVLLATVKGDVHDIGKNLVGILIANNGYEVIDLGIKVDPATLAAAISEHRPQVVGLSGLLVKSAHQMVATAEDLRQAGIDVPILVGGAALSRRFTETRILPRYDGLVLYARDAMEGLALANRLVEEGPRAELEIQVAETRRRAAQAEDEPAPEPAAAEEQAPAGRAVAPAPEIPRPPHFERRLVRMEVSELLGWINEQMLYGRHLGLRGNVERLRAEGHAKLAELRHLVEELAEEGATRGWLEPAGVYRFYGAHAEGSELVLADEPGGAEVMRWSFPRQRERDRLCITDWVEPEAAANDSVALFVVTAGRHLRRQAEAFKEAGEFLRSHTLLALGLELAEAAAEWLHARIRREWGLGDEEQLSMREIHRAHYRGLRVSFGYPACPGLEHQVGLFDLLAPADIGVELTDGMMMDPEASVSALVFHHPEARYFSA